MSESGSHVGHQVKMAVCTAVFQVSYGWESLCVLTDIDNVCAADHQGCRLVSGVALVERHHSLYAGARVPQPCSLPLLHMSLTCPAYCTHPSCMKQALHACCVPAELPLSGHKLDPLEITSCTGEHPSTGRVCLSNRPEGVSQRAGQSMWQAVILMLYLCCTMQVAFLCRWTLTVVTQDGLTTCARNR